jgi:hypothetical protein
MSAPNDTQKTVSSETNSMLPTIRQLTPDPEFSMVRVPVIEDESERDDMRRAYEKRLKAARKAKEEAEAAAKKAAEEERARREEAVRALVVMVSTKAFDAILGQRQEAEELRLREETIAPMEISEDESVREVRGPLRPSGKTPVVEVLRPKARKLKSKPIVSLCLIWNLSNFQR